MKKVKIKPLRQKPVKENKVTMGKVTMSKVTTSDVTMSRLTAKKLKLKKNKKAQGVINAWVVGLIGLFVVGLIWLVFAQPYKAVYNLESQQITDAQATNTNTILRTAYYSVPVLLMISLIVWILVAGTRKEEYPQV